MGDYEEEETGSIGGKDWRGVPYKLNFESEEEKLYFEKARHLVQTTRESLYDAIKVCRPGNCLSDVGAAIQDRADANNYCTVEKYRGHGTYNILCAGQSLLFLFMRAVQHDLTGVVNRRFLGISHNFHCAPYVSHFRNNDRMELRPGMIFTIEPMLTMGSARCFEWKDDWTVATVDNSLAAQFEHTILITEGDPEILTLPGDSL